MDSTTPATLLHGRAWAKQAGRQQVVEVLRDAARDWDHKVRFTFWRGGVTATLGGTVSRPGAGVVIEAPLVEYVSGLKSYSHEVFPKGEGLVIAHGISTTLGSHDAECEAITWGFGDADEVGDWDPLRVAFAEAGLAYVMGRSASSTVDKPRWHLEVPLAQPLVPEGDLADFKHRYCAEYGFILGILSEVGGLACVPGGKPGFDPATSRLLQPMYPGCRRTVDSTAPETVFADGKALDWSALIKSSGFTPPPAPPKSTKKPSGSKVDMDPNSSGEVPGLARAMEIDGLFLGMKNGKALVRCVREDQHTTGTAGDTSTVILPGGALGVFNCKHSHCISLNQQDVIAMLSEEAQAFIADLLAVAGLERLKRQLDTQADLFSQECSLDEIEQVVGKRLDDFDGGVLVIVIPTGAGKTRAARKVLVVRKAGVLAVPSHALGGECADALEADGVAVQRRRGVVRAASDLGACKHMSLALQVQQAGGSVPVLCCSRCSERSSCPARRPEGPDGNVIVLPHALLPALKDGTEADKDMPSRELVVIDETPQLWTEVVIKEPLLAQALATLGASTGALVEARFRAGHLVLAKLLLEMKGGAIPMDMAANAVIASGEAKSRRPPCP